MSQKLLVPAKLLNEYGLPIQFGYATKPIVETNPGDLRHPIRYKEWDFYQISDRNWTLQVTFGHVSYAGAINAVLFDYAGNRYEATLPLLFPMQSLGLAATAATPCHLSKHTKNYKIDIDVGDGERKIIVDASTKAGPCRIKMSLSYPCDSEGILVVTPFEKPDQFYHNYKQNCMIASGYAQFGEVRVEFKPDEAFGLIDWGRGVLPYRHSWWWGNGSTLIDGHYVGFNIGVFGNTSYATENTVFYDYKAHKLGNISFRRDSYMSPWTFTSDDNRFEFVFTPVFDNFTSLNLLIAHNRCHQVFGKWNGKLVLNNGKKLEIKDMFAFVEEAHNRW
jgi:hypothetical protein